MKITDKMRLDWLADCTVKESEMIYDHQFSISQEISNKSRSLRMAIDAAIRAEVKEKK